MFSSRKKKEEAAAPTRIISDPTLLPSAPIESTPTLLERRRPSAPSGSGSDDVLRVSSPSSKAKVEGTAANVGFHKPSGFQGSTGTTTGTDQSEGRLAGPPLGATGTDLPPIMNTPPRPPRSDTIAALYPSPSASSTPSVPYTSTFRASTSYDAQLSSLATTPSLPNVRKSLNLPPTLNILVAGARSTGKTSWIKTFLGTIRCANSTEEAKLSQFAVVGANGIARTMAAAQVACKILVEGGGRLSLSVRDTAGLEVPYQVGKVGDEREVEQQVASIVKDIENRFETTLAAESAVTRLSSRAQDDHLHLCVYFIHPSTISSRPVRHESDTIVISTPPVSTSQDDNSYAARMRSLSDAALPDSIDAQPKGTANGDASNGRAHENVEEEVGMSEVDLKAIKKLSARINVLPVLALSDTLTISQMANLKSIIKRDLKRHGLDFGVFETDAAREDDDSPPVPSIPKSFSNLSIKSQSQDRSRPNHSRDSTANSAQAEEEEEEDDYGEPESLDPPPKLIKLTRSISHSTKLSSRHRPGKRSISKLAEAAALETKWNGGNEDGADLGESLPFSLVAPEFAESTGGAVRYERKFAYGTIDILDPQHTDFMLLRNAILGKQLKVLRETTRIQKYESYRTTKLLHRRATTMMTEQSKQELSKELSPLS